MFPPTEWKSNAQGFASWVERTTSVAHEAARSSAQNAKSTIEQGKRLVKDHREDTIQKLSTEVAQSETARNLINLLI